MNRHFAEYSVIEFWFDFASTYSYLAAARIEALATAAGVDVVWRPFLLGPIFKAQGWPDSPFNLQAAKGRYMWRDLERLCADAGLAFCRPSVFPRHSVLAARVGLTALNHDWGVAFCRAVFRANLAEDRDISDAAVLAELVVDVGGDPDQVMPSARTDEIKTKLRDATAQAERAGIFGAPSFLVGDELFWGNDRLEQALAFAAQDHVTRASAAPTPRNTSAPC